MLVVNVALYVLFVYSSDASPLHASVFPSAVWAGANHDSND